MSTPAQRTLVQFLELDSDLVKAAASKSPDVIEPKDEQLASLVPLLPDEEKLDFLQRLSREEPGLALKLNHRLRELSGASVAPMQESEDGWTIGDLQRAADDIKERQKTQERLAREKQREAYLVGLSEGVDELWEEVDELIQTKQSKKYDKAVSLLVDLRDLAVLEDDLETFREWLQELVDDYSSRHGLLRRLRAVELLD